MLINTKRLSLAPLTHDDIDGIFALRSDPDIMKYTGIKPYSDISQAQGYVEGIIATMPYNKHIVWSICLSSSNAFLGTICLWNYSSDMTRAEIGYDLLTEYQGIGYMSEAMDSVIDYAFNIMQFSCIFADLMPANNASVKLVMRKGFHHVEDHDRILAGNLCHMSVYELHR